MCLVICEGRSVVRLLAIDFHSSFFSRAYVTPRSDHEDDRTAASTFDRVAIDLSHDAFPGLADAIRARSDCILKHWRELSLKAMPHLDALSLVEFENTIAIILSAAADALQTSDPQQLRGVVETGPRHGIDRFVHNHSLLDLFEEVRILRRVIVVEVGQEMTRPLNIGEASTFHGIFDIIVQQGVIALVQKQNEATQRAHETMLEMNQKLLMSSVEQTQLTELAQNAEQARSRSERRLAAELDSTRRLQEISARLIHSNRFDDLYQHIVDAAADIMHSDTASLQMLYPERKELHLLAHHGFTPEAVQDWEWVRAEHATTCGRALDSGARCTISDIEQCDWMADTEDLATSRQTGIRSVQSTPLFSRKGQVLGMISTHWRTPHEAAEDDLRQFDILARLAADLIERRKVDEALRESEELYRTLFDLGPVAIYSIDAAGVIQNFNRQAGKLWGREPAIGDTDERFCGSFKMFRPDGTYMPHDLCPMADVVSSKATEVRDGEVHIERPDGSRVTVIVNIRPLKNERGDVIGAVNCFYDISERVALENRVKQQAEAIAGESRRKDEFLAMLSHELRNPLAPIRTAIHLLRSRERGTEDALQKQAHEIIERQVGNITKMVNDLLEVSRVASGRVRLNLQTVDMNEVVAHAMETVRPLFEQRKHEAEFICCPLPVWCNADATRLEEVFTNLLNNAAKYTPNGGCIDIRCEAISETEEAQFAQFRVRDTGVGIEKDLLPRIFDLFTQADRSLDRSQGGLGIGLSLAKRLIELHGGSVEARSDGPGLGAEFIVRLALVEPPASTTRGEPQESMGALVGTRVLIVDDNIDMVMMLASALRAKGYSVQSAYTGPDGLKVAQQWRPEVVLLDIGLPGLDGYQVARRLRSNPTQGSTDEKLRLIALTGYGRETDIARARDAGFDAHLVKPYEFEQLESLMRSSEIMS